MNVDIIPFLIFYLNYLQQVKQIVLKLSCKETNVKTETQEWFNFFIVFIEEANCENKKLNHRKLKIFIWQ